MEPGDFTDLAEAYRRSRPGYPPALVDALLRRAGVRRGDPVCDAGAGTGILAAMLAERGLRVTAVEPNEAMRRNAPLLHGVRWVPGSFEATGLATGSQAWVAAAQSFHWADPTRALPELRRILRPGGRLSALWNERENGDSETLAWVEEAMRRHAPAYRGGRRLADPAATIVSTGDFSRVEVDEERQVVRMGRARFVELWMSRNVFRVAAGVEGAARFRADLEAHLDRVGALSIDVPYRCVAFTAVARPA